MNTKKRTSIIGGALLILIGGALLAVQILPNFYIPFSWPWIVIGVGLFLFALGAATGEPGMAIPACIVGGIGGILAYQNVTGDWASWSYIWALIPGFVGVGILLAKLLGGEKDTSLWDIGWLILISLILFTVFGSFFGDLGVVGDYWPVLLILLGLGLLVRPFLRRNA
ncbi:MAG: hypothetical protein U9O54_02700 [Chloroflexota bacterium]|nr:hypothetical protein [Chloroflexota bacterium]